jgi:geranylgeranyl diphosphate synthase, type II
VTSPLKENKTVNEALNQKMASHAQLLGDFLNHHFTAKADYPVGHSVMLESMRYSLLQEGSKRFRPVLAMLTAEALGQHAARVLPLGAAIECIHTYSLIHDDLPAMDNDDFRRGQPTNHKKFNEATAILAGDALLTEAFQIIADNYASEPQLALSVVAEVAKASGLHGMVGGQAIDMASKKESITLEDLQLMHRWKTGALIRLSAVGAARLCRATDRQMVDVTKYSESLGLAFQVADDILDYDPEKIEPGSYPALLGLEDTKLFLDQLTEMCLSQLRQWPASAEPLREIALYNRSRNK